MKDPKKKIKKIIFKGVGNLEKKKLYILILAITLFLSSYSFAVEVDFNNGTFETGDFSDWNAVTIYNFNRSGTVSVQGNTFTVTDIFPITDTYSAFCDQNITSVGISYLANNCILTTSDPINASIYDQIQLDLNINYYATITWPYLNYWVKLYDVDTGNYYNSVSGTFKPTTQACWDSTNYKPPSDINCTQETRWYRGDTTGLIHSTLDISNVTTSENVLVKFVIQQVMDNSHAGFGVIMRTKTRLDNIKLVNTGSITLTNEITEPQEPINSSTPFLISIKVYDNTLEDYISDANVRFNWDSGEYFYLDYSESNSAYILESNGLPSGDYNFSVDTNKLGGYTSDYDEGILQVRTQEYQYLTVTPINNILSYSFGSIDFVISSVNPDVYTTWRVDSNSATTEYPEYTWFNTDTTGRQYFVYTSSNGSDWVFDATLTYGSDNTNPVQKIWNETRKRFEYSVTDTLSALETKYYKLEFQKPVKHWEAIGNSEEWLIMNPPVVVTDVNRFDYDEYSVSQYAGIRNIFKEFVPDISGDETIAYELQFTAKSDVNGTKIEVGQTVNGTDSGKSSVELTSTWHRYSFSINGTDFDSQILMINSQGTSANIQITDYALIPRGFFTKRLEIRQANGDYLPLFLLDGFSKQYLQEGNEFRITTGAYDRKGNIDELRLEGYFDSVTANNLVKKSVFDVYGTDVETKVKIETILDFDQVFPAIIDLNGTANNPASPRNFILKANIYDENGVNVAVQSQMIKFIQYPYFPNDLRINFFPTEKRQGKNPKGLLELKMSRMENLQGFDLRIYSDGNTVNAPNYRTRIYKDTDFKCDFDECLLNITVDEYLFEDLNLTTITWFALLNTEYLNQDNNLTRTDRRIYVSEIEYSTAKVLQVNERPRNIYRNDEEIPLVMVLRDSEADPLINKVETYLTLQNCDSNVSGAVNCVDQTIQYKPTGYLYDAQNNASLFFFTHLFVLDNGNLLPDGNYISFVGNVTDNKGIRKTVNPILTSRCSSNLFETASDLVVAGLKTFTSVDWALQSTVTASICTSGLEEEVVTSTKNASSKQYLQIDDDFNRTSPKLNSSTCIHPNARGGLANPLKEKIACAVHYTAGEKPIDAFRFRIYNNYSDFDKTGSDKQFYEVVVPNELIAYNDKTFLFNSLIDNYDSTVTTREILYEGFKSINTVAIDLWDIATSLDIERALNYDLQEKFIDLDYSFTTTDLNGFFFFTVDELQVINAQDYAYESKIKDVFDEIPRTSFFKYLNENSVNLPKNKIKTRIYMGSIGEPFEIISEDRILIDEKPSDNTIIKQGDLNSTYSNTLPITLNFDLGITMFFNNFSEHKTINKTLDYYVVIEETVGNATLKFWDSITTKPVETLIDYLHKNLIMLMIISGILLIIGVIYVLYFRS